MEGEEGPVSDLLDMVAALPPAGAFRGRGGGDAVATPSLGSLMGSVIKVFTVAVTPSYSRPWRRNDQQSTTGSGFVLAGRVILTNAHVVHNHATIRVRRHGRATKHTARLLCEGQEADLALLTVDDEAFWDGLEPLELAPASPPLNADVSLCGFPMGGDNLSVTRGVVSRYDVAEYASRAGKLLTVQIDAAVNPGNSGGPVFSEGEGEGGGAGGGRALRVVGVARAKLSSHTAENIGYVIPLAVVRLFMESYDKFGRFRGICGMGMHWQKLESDALARRFCSGDAGRKDAGGGRVGVLCRTVAPLGACAGVLAPDDVLLTIDGHPIAADGTISLADGLPSGASTQAVATTERILFVWLISSKMPGSTVTLELLRGGEPLRRDVRLFPTPRLAPILDGVDARPRFVIYGGLVFLQLSLQWIHTTYSTSRTSWRHAAPPRLRLLMSDDKLEKDREIVILSHVLAHDCNFGYQSMRGLQLLSCNGEEVRNLAHLEGLLCNVRDRVDAGHAGTAEGESVRVGGKPLSDAPTKAEFTEFELDDDDIIVLDVHEVHAAEPGILKQHNIPRLSNLDEWPATDDDNGLDDDGLSLPKAVGPDAPAAAQTRDPSSESMT